MLSKFIDPGCIILPVVVEASVIGHAVMGLPRDEPEQPPLPSDTHTPDQPDVHSTLPGDKTNPAAPYVATTHPNAASAHHRYAS